MKSRGFILKGSSPSPFIICIQRIKYISRIPYFSIFHTKQSSKIVKKICILHTIKINNSSHRKFITSPRLFNNNVPFSKEFIIYIFLCNFSSNYIIIVNNPLVSKISSSKHWYSFTSFIICSPFARQCFSCNFN